MRLLLIVFIMFGLSSLAYAADPAAPSSINVPPWSNGSFTVSWSPSAAAPACEQYDLEESEDPTFETGVTTVTLPTPWVTSVVIKGKTDGTWYYRVRSICTPTKYWAAYLGG